MNGYIKGKRDMKPSAGTREQYTSLIALDKRSRNGQKIGMKSLALPICILLVSIAAHVMAENPPPDPSLCGPHPTNYKEIVNKWLETQLIDPSSARIEWHGNPKPAHLGTKRE